MEKLELEFYKTKKFIFGILFLILLACAVVFNQPIRFEIERYGVISQYTFYDDLELNSYFSRESYKYERNSLKHDLQELSAHEIIYLDSQLELQKFLRADRE